VPATWRIAPVSLICGHCLTGERLTPIEAGDVVLEVRLVGVSRPMYRCQACGQAHVPLTDDAIAAAQAARVATLAREGLHDAAAPERWRPTRPPRSWASMAESAGKLFDFGKAAAGDRE
jgi:hypothetical protein